MMARLVFSGSLSRISGGISCADPSGLCSVFSGALCGLGLFFSFISLRFKGFPHIRTDGFQIILEGMRIRHGPGFRSRREAHRQDDRPETVNEPIYHKRIFGFQEIFCPRAILCFHHISPPYPYANLALNKFGVKEAIFRPSPSRQASPPWSVSCSANCFVVYCPHISYMKFPVRAPSRKTVGPQGFLKTKGGRSS